MTIPNLNPKFSLKQHMNSRRSFIKKTALIAAAAATTPSFAFSTIAKPNVGLQLYSLRDIIKNDIKGIIKKVAEIGYREVETYGYTKRKWINIPKWAFRNG